MPNKVAKGGCCGLSALPGARVDLLHQHPMAVLHPENRHHRRERIAVGVKRVRAGHPFELRLSDSISDLCPGWNGAAVGLHSTPDRIDQNADAVIKGEGVARNV